MWARAFADQPVDAALVRRILTTARQSPSGGNVQPWHVIVLGAEELARLKAIMRDKLADPRAKGDGPGYPIYPRELDEPYRSRRFKCGEDMHGTMHISREDKASR
jgi:nitroreductase